MLRFFTLISLYISLFVSCTNKEMQLPIINMEGIHEIQNHSSIWIFLDTQGKDTIAKLNKNNKLLNTHWIFNVDRRLKMDQIIPLLQEMQANRNKDSMHKKGGMLNYFSYADIASSNISLVSFDQTEYIFLEKEYQKLISELSASRVIELEVYNNKLLLDKKECNFDQFKERIKTYVSKDSLSTTQWVLKYEEKTSYQQYLHTKVILSKSDVKINPVEYIFN